MKRAMISFVILCFTATSHAAWWTKKTSEQAEDTAAAVQATGEAKAASTQPPKAAVEVIKGTIVSLNAPQNEIVIKDEKTTYDRVLIVKPEMYKSIKLGDAVMVKIKGGSNVVEDLKVTKAAPVEKKVAATETGSKSKGTDSKSKSKSK